MQLDQDINSIIEPAEVSYWPLQPGWYLVFGILLLGILILIIKSYRIWLRQVYKREAISQVSSLENDQNFFFQLNIILKSVAIQTKGRDKVAYLSGKEWCDFLVQSKRGNAFSTEVLRGFEHSNYIKKDDGFEDKLIEEAKKESQKWIKYL